MEQASHAIADWAWLALGAVWLVASFTTKRTARRQPAGELILHICVLALAFGLLFGKFPTGSLRWRFVADTGASEWTGGALTVAGIAFAMWARLFIGRNWSGMVELKEDHTLVRTGPYAFVRHPIYAGLLLAVLGTAIVYGQVRGLIGLGLLIVEWKRKSLVEERLMIEHFGADYLQYRRDVKGLVPFLW